MSLNQGLDVGLSGVKVTIPEGDLPQWFALTVKPRHEKAVAEQLQSRALEGYLPLHQARHRWSDRMKKVELPLFPRYVFSRFAFDHRARVLGLPGVTSIVGFGGKPCPVSDTEIDSLKALVNSGQTLMVWPYLRTGQKVRITEGAMEGVEGILVREKSGYRVVINVELLNRAVAVEIERECVQPVANARPSVSPGLYLRA